MNNQNNLQSPSFRPQAQIQVQSLAGAGELLKRAWHVYQQRFGVFLGLVLISLIFPLLIVLLSLYSDQISSLVSLLLTVILGLISVAVSFWVQISLIFAVKEREQKIGVKESLARGWHKIISYSWILILTGLITMGGMLLFIVPGIIFAVWFSLAVYVLVAEDKKGITALFASKQLVEGKWWSVFWRFLAVGLLVGGITVLISLIAKFFNVSFVGNVAQSLAIPFTVAFEFLLYEELKRVKIEAVPEASKKRTKVKFILVAVAGFLLISAILYMVFFRSLSDTQARVRDVRRQADIRMMVVAQEMYYSVNNHYYQSVNYPSSIPGFITETPADPAGKSPYGWINNTKNPQEFCAYADLEGDGFYVASRAGNGEVDAQPILFSDCEKFSQKIISPQQKEEGLSADQLIEDAQLKIQEVMTEMAKADGDSIKVQKLVAEAINKAVQATELEPENPEIWFQRGNIYYQIRDLVLGADEWALKSYQKALELNPSNTLYQQKVEELIK
ncbi:MAG: hypothetical protein Q8P63_00820 [Candidatus Nealsonbacteria bacterium]|nr:hypothetical protein [Candidatus Nealsonbacteria bacterium]